MDELLTYTEGDSDTADSKPTPSGEVISEGPVLIGPIDLPKVDELFSSSSTDDEQQKTEEGGQEGKSDSSPAEDGEPEVTVIAEDGEGTLIPKVAKNDDAETEDEATKVEASPSPSEHADLEVYEAEDSATDDEDGEDEYADFVDNFWSPVQYTEHDNSARVVRTLSLAVGGVLVLFSGVALSLPALGVPGGTSLAGIAVQTQEDGPKAVEELQRKIDQTAFSLTNKRGETITKSGAELGLKVDGEQTTKGLNSWISRSAVWLQRATGEVTLPVIVSGGNNEVISEAAKAITLDIKEPEVTLTPTGAQSTPGVDGYTTDEAMLTAGLKDTIASVTSKPGNWSGSPIEVVTTGRTMPPQISPADVDAVTAQWNHVLNTPVTLVKALNMPEPAVTPTVDPSASGSASASPSGSAKASDRASASASAKSGTKASEGASDDASATADASASPSTTKSRSASPSASASSAAAPRIPSFNGMTLVSHVIAQAESASAAPQEGQRPSEAEPVEGATPAATVEEGEGESKAGEQNIQDEQTPQITDQVGGELKLTHDDLVAIIHVVPDFGAEPGNKMKLKVKTDALPDSLKNFFAANTITKGLKAHIEGEQVPPGRAAAADKSLHDVSRVKGEVVVDSMADGFVPNEEATLQAILDAAQGAGGTVNLIGLEDKVSSPESLGIKEPISTFTSFFSAGQSRVKNIHRIADLVDGVVVGPGQSFELNKHVGRRTRKNGFTDGGAIQEGQMVSEVGGGVSQFATTFFNAAWFSGVLIPQHKAHSQYFSRYPAGREATLNYPGVNLEIKNDTPYAILIDTSHTSSSVTVTFWSTKYWNVESDRSKCLCVPHAAFPVTWTRTRTNPEGKSEKWTVTTYYQSPKPKKKD